MKHGLTGSKSKSLESTTFHLELVLTSLEAESKAKVQAGLSFQDANDFLIFSLCLHIGT